MKTRKALGNFIIFVLLAILFNILVLILKGEQAGIEFLGGYLIELSLSLDNLFLFLMIFSSFGIPSKYQKRVLNYGVFGAIVLRLIFILLGVSVVNKFHWVLYFFGILLILSSLKMIFKVDKEIDFKRSYIYKGLRFIIPFTDSLVGEKFFVRKNKILYATPLFAILLIIEMSDILFAIDSIPAIFSITTDPFIVYTSNIFAILGLRSLYFILVKINNMFKYVQYGVAGILMFTGIKLSILYFNIEIPVMNSILVIVIILIISIIISLISEAIACVSNKLN